MRLKIIHPLRSNAFGPQAVARKRGLIKGLEHAGSLTNDPHLWTCAISNFNNFGCWRFSIKVGQWNKGHKQLGILHSKICWEPLVALQHYQNLSFMSGSIPHFFAIFAHSIPNYLFDEKRSSRPPWTSKATTKVPSFRTSKCINICKPSFVLGETWSKFVLGGLSDFHTFPHSCLHRFGQPGSHMDVILGWPTSCQCH